MIVFILGRICYRGGESGEGAGGGEIGEEIIFKILMFNNLIANVREISGSVYNKGFKIIKQCCVFRSSCECIPTILSCLICITRNSKIHHFLK